jgi:hypothetical protein
LKFVSAIKWPFLGLGISLFALLTLVSAKTASEDVVIDTAMPASIPPEIVADWKIKDSVSGDFAAAILKIKSKLPSQYASKIDTGSTEDLYIKACHWRRVARIQPFSEDLGKLLCARHFNVGGYTIGFLEDMNDDTVGSIGEAYPNIAANSKGDQYKAGAALLMLDFKDYYPAPLKLLEDTTGVIRDPCVSFDGERVAFAWSKDNNGYHIFEIDVNNPDTCRQLTWDLPDYTVSDFEPCYLPNGDIVFNSSRCFQGYADNINVVSNLFIMNKDGKYLRRICYDQAQDFHPTVMSDGKIMFSRWEFNDRNLADVFGVFTMNPDGTNQNEYFGNQLSWPSTFPNAREIPGSGGKFLSIIGQVNGHVYQGDLVLVDPTKGRNTVDAVQLIAPKRTTKPALTAISDANRKFQDPYPLNETWFLISYTDKPNATVKYRLYLMDVDGNRELLAWDANQSISQPIPLCKKKVPRIACRADYSKETAQVGMTNAYYGTGTGSAVSAGAIKKIRVIALEYRMYPWIGSTGTTPPMGTPVARYLGSRESKRIVGEMKVEADGSAACIVPARTPLYVQLIDSGGCMIQSMRSWMTLQPGEKFDCFGCHEDKNVSPPPHGTPLAFNPKKIEPFFDILDDYLCYPKYIQPILNGKCVSCHVAGHSSGLDLGGDTLWTGDLNGDANNNSAERFWCRSYLNLTDPKKKLVNFISIQSQAEGLKPNATVSKLITTVRKPPAAMAGVALSEEEMSKICAWIDLCIPHGGKYTDDMKAEHAQFYEQRLLLRKQEEAFEARNIAEFVTSGGYNNADYSRTFIESENQGKISRLRTKAGTRKLSARFLPGSRQFVMNLPSAGDVSLFDLKGRRMFSATISNTEYINGRGTARHTPATGLPSGLYIVKFRGEACSAENVIPVF